jgi:hypothetical protein
MIKDQYESQKSEKHVSLRSPEEAGKFILPMNCVCLRKQAFETTVRFCCADDMLRETEEDGIRRVLLLVFRRNEDLRWLSPVASSCAAVFGELPRGFF